MVKVHTTLNIDNEVLERAKSEQLNLSGEFEEAIKKRLNVKIVEIQKPEKCTACGLECPMETAADILSKRTVLGQSNPNRLTWLWPDEIWICNKCLEKRIRTDMNSGLK